MADHIHMCLSIPPKYSVSNTVGLLKSKSAVRIHRELQGQRPTTGFHFWATGYCVSTVGLDEDTIRQYIREQDELQRRRGETDQQHFDFE
jgi:putative transposase